MSSATTTTEAPTALTWNDARSVAARVITEVDDHGTLANATLPESVTQLDQEAVVNRVESASGDRTERIDEVARWLCEATESTSGMPHPSFDSWNTARSLAAQFVTYVEDASGSYDTVRAQWEEALPPADVVEDRVQSATGESRTECINDIARWVLEWGAEEWDEEVLTEQSIDDPEREIAEALYDVFEERAYSYSEIPTEEWPEYTFPPRQVAMMYVRNAAPGRSDRIAELAEWVSNWDDPEVREEALKKVPPRRHGPRLEW